MGNKRGLQGSRLWVWTHKKFKHAPNVNTGKDRWSLAFSTFMGCMHICMPAPHTHIHKLTLLKYVVWNSKACSILCLGVRTASNLKFLHQWANIANKMLGFTNRNFSFKNRNVVTNHYTVVVRHSLACKYRATKIIPCLPYKLCDERLSFLNLFSIEKPSPMEANY